MSYIETDSNHPLFRFAKKYPKLFKRYFVEEIGGHYGLELPTKVIERFMNAKFKPIYEETAWDLFWPLEAYVNFLDNEYKEKSHMVKLIVVSSKVLQSNMITEIIANCTMGICSKLISPFMRLDNKQGLLCCYEKNTFEVHPMLSRQMKDDIKNLVKGKIFLNETMKNHTSFRIGGPTNIIIPKDINNLKNILKFTSENNISVTIIGNGTNLLVSDDGIEGVVIKIKDCLDNILINKQQVTVGAGCLLSKLSKVVANRGLSGLEFAIGIPGTVGGAVVMNAGAHGGEMSNVVTKVKLVNFKGEISELSKDNLEFGYRKSRLQKQNLIVLEVEVELRNGNMEEIKEKMQKYLEWRKKNQPIDIPNAGSIFKNPENDYAGRLIDLAGCKGMKIGGAQISELKANFIVNIGDAASQDVLNLINRVQEKVLKKFNVKLLPEIKTIGNWRDETIIKKLQE